MPRWNLAGRTRKLAFEEAAAAWAQGGPRLKAPAPRLVVFRKFRRLIFITAGVTQLVRHSMSFFWETDRAGEPRRVPHQGALEKGEFLSLAPCFSWVIEGLRATSTVLTVSRVLVGVREVS